MSLPAWECGLKSGSNNFSADGKVVTPCVGVWIEIFSIFYQYTSNHVTPCVGVWIEILLAICNASNVMSLPAWECGLKWEYAVCF